MTRKWSLGRRAATALVSGMMLLQVGPCTGDLLREQLGAGLRTALNGFFASLTNQFVTDFLNLP